MKKSINSKCLAWIDLMYLKCKVCDTGCQLKKPLIDLIIKYRIKEEHEKEWKQLIGDIESENKKAQK